MSKQSQGAALPPVFALGTSTGSQLLGNSKLLAREMNTFLGPQECSLDRNQRLQMVTLEKSWGPTVSGYRDRVPIWGAYWEGWDPAVPKHCAPGFPE